jgi:hypothetical protein
MLCNAYDDMVSFSYHNTRGVTGTNSVTVEHKPGFVVFTYLEDGSLVEGADALEEAVAGDHAAPELARGRGAEEADGRADTQEDQLQDFIGEVVDACPRAPAAAIIPSHGWRSLTETF